MQNPFSFGHFFCSALIVCLSSITVFLCPACHIFASLSRPVVQGQLEAKAIALQEAKVNDVSRTFPKLCYRVWAACLELSL
jgi:hypothetical protein